MHVKENSIPGLISKACFWTNKYANENPERKTIRASNHTKTKAGQERNSTCESWILSVKMVKK